MKSPAPVRTESVRGASVRGADAGPAARRGALRAVRVAAATAALVASAAACSSTGTGEAVRPTAVAEQRAVLAERRAATRSAMEEAMGRPSIADQAAETGGTALGVLGRLGGVALDVLSLRALGLW